MPMNAARLTEYISVYDVDLDHSLVAMQGDEMRGVAMLGVREGRAWITRLGVIPTTRRTGVGEALTVGLLEQARKLNINFDMLEVIKNNTPAHTLFLKLGFYEIGELLVLRRSPVPPPDPVVASAERLDRAEFSFLWGVTVAHSRGPINPNPCSMPRKFPGCISHLPMEAAAGWFINVRNSH